MPALDHSRHSLLLLPLTIQETWESWVLHSGSPVCLVLGNMRYSRFLFKGPL